MLAGPGQTVASPRQPRHPWSADRPRRVVGGAAARRRPQPAFGSGRSGDHPCDAGRARPRLLGRRGGLAPRQGQRHAVHIDGARLFNAQVASGIPVARWAALADTVTFCFSTGLGAPAGAMVVGDAQTVERARHVRKRLGGAMRQTGVLAAAGKVGLDRGVGRLADDHRRARVPADAIAKMVPAALDHADVQTNIVHFETTGLGVEASAFVGYDVGVDADRPPTRSRGMTSRLLRPGAACRFWRNELVGLFGRVSLWSCLITVVRGGRGVPLA
ncbi:threonine aldolase family protein [Streptomyces sp. NPDC004227]